MKAGVVIVCAGEGRRLGRKDKTVMRFSGKPLFMHSVDTFRKIKTISQIVLVLGKSNLRLAKRLIKERCVSIVEGGPRRQDSVSCGLTALNKDIDYVLIHDGARPFVDKGVILRILKELRRHPAVICGIPVKDTLKLIKQAFVKRTLDRKDNFLIQTPQGFKKDLLIKAYNKFRNRAFFDDAQAWERGGGKVKIVDGDVFNIKITYPQDIALARLISDERL